MRFSEHWLREWVNPPISTQELAHQLTMAGLEVDAVEPIAPAFEGVVVGEVVEVAPHPDADKLRVCQVNVGRPELLKIVCGAANVREGLRVPTAVVGATLPGDFKIKRAKLRGVESFGMLCSAKELGLAEISDGLMELPADSPVGEDFRAFLELDDNAIELGLTPNRGDCLSIAGIAREVGVLNEMAVEGPAIAEVPAATDSLFPVSIAAPGDCPRYVGRVIRGVDARAETPLWMQERLRRSGVRSLGPLVDVTNYVLLELGQPMHAFDLGKLRGGISVRRAEEGEKLLLLNDAEVTLDPDALVIADAERAVALAGIMGGSETAVDDESQDIFLESAFFSPESLAGRARRFGLHTDSSHRFERGVSFELQRLAVERATALLLGIVGGEAGPVVEVEETAALPRRKPVALRHSRIQTVLGGEIPAPNVESILRRLEMKVEGGSGQWQVTPPAFRFDIAIEEDLIEEVGRIYGYERLPSAAPASTLRMLPVPEAKVSVARMRQLLVARGYQEAVSYSFVDPQIQKVLDPEGDPIVLANPISADLSVMRTGLWPGLVQTLLHNIRRQQNRVRMFETGLRFVHKGDEIRQEAMLGGLVYGSVNPEQWGEKQRLADFFDVKADVEALLGLSGPAAEFGFLPKQLPILHPGQSAQILREGRPVGWLGALHPAVERELDLPSRTFVFELQLDSVVEGMLPKFRESSRFPAIRRDIAVVVDEGITAEEVIHRVRKAAPETLLELKLFDVYAGEHIDSGRKSLALGLTLQAQSRTLTDEEVESAIEKILETLSAELGAILRD